MTYAMEILRYSREGCYIHVRRTVSRVTLPGCETEVVTPVEHITLWTPAEDDSDPRKKLEKMSI